MTTLEREELEIIAYKKGYRFSNYGDQPTHAICVHGVMAALTIRDHICFWTLLIKVEQEAATRE